MKNDYFEWSVQPEDHRGDYEEYYDTYYSKEEAVDAVHELFNFNYRTIRVVKMIYGDTWEEDEAIDEKIYKNPNYDENLPYGEQLYLE